ncbi:hypothetical protein OTU49_001609 [Cherax quadricarinatus]|uniref:Uncharacterized protein n=1 Tax=Cherax quadricarinatus TaxID=27406 RepID=A0AAW0XQF7_CHEQU
MESSVRHTQDVGPAKVGGPTRRPTKAEGPTRSPTKVKGPTRRPTKVEGPIRKPTKVEGPTRKTYILYQLIQSIHQTDDESPCVIIYQLLTSIIRKIVYHPGI